MLIMGVPEEEKKEQGVFTVDGKNLINFMKILIWQLKKKKSKWNKQRSMTKMHQSKHIKKQRQRIP